MEKANLNNSENRIYIMLPLSILLLNIQLFKIGNAAIKLNLLFTIIIVLGSIRQEINVKSIFLLLLYLIIPVLSAVNILDINEFIKSYVSYVLSVALIFLGIDYHKNLGMLFNKKMFALLFRGFNVSVIYGIIQFVSANLFNNLGLYNNLGVFQFHSHRYNVLYGFYRATSIFIEPSVFAWIATSVFVLLFYLKDSEIISYREKVFTYLMCFMALIITISASGYVGFIAIIIVIIITQRLSYEIVMGFIAALFIPLSVFVFKPEIIDYLRLGEISSYGSSGYYRFMEPLFASFEVMDKYPIFGRGLGQIGVNDPDLVYNVIIHNSFYGIFITFGLVVLLYIVPIIVSFVIQIKKDKNTIPLFLNLLYIFATTGAFLSLEIPIIYSLSILAINYKRNFNEITVVEKKMIFNEK